MSIHTRKGKFQIQTATLWYYISTMICYLCFRFSIRLSKSFLGAFDWMIWKWWMLDTVFVFVCLCFPVFVFSYFCVWSFFLSALQMMSVGLTVFVPQHPLPLASLSDLVSRNVEKSLKMRTVLYFWQFWSKYIYDLSGGMIVNMHTHTHCPPEEENCHEIWDE